MSAPSTRPGTVAPVTPLPTQPVKPAPVSDAEKTAATSAPVNHAPVVTTKGGVQNGAGLTRQAFTYTLNGRTMTWAYETTGQQHLFQAMPEGNIMAAGNSIGAYIDFGDGQDTGADLGAMVCKPKSALAPFHDTIAPTAHTYSQPGTYTVKVTTTFCGDNGPQPVTKSYQVVVP